MEALSSSLPRFFFTNTFYGLSTSWIGMEPKGFRKHYTGVPGYFVLTGKSFCGVLRQDCNLSVPLSSCPKWLIQQQMIV